MKRKTNRWNCERALNELGPTGFVPKTELTMDTIWAEEPGLQVWVIIDANLNKRIEIRDGDRILASATLQQFRAERLARQLEQRK